MTALLDRPTAPTSVERERERLIIELNALTKEYAELEVDRAMAAKMPHVPSWRAELADAVKHNAIRQREIRQRLTGA